MVFQYWCIDKHINLQVGVVYEQKIFENEILLGIEDRILLPSHSLEDQVELEILWIHNDNKIDEDTFGHYSGLAFLPVASLSLVVPLSSVVAGSIIAEDECVAPGHADEEEKVKKKGEEEEEEEEVKKNEEGEHVAPKQESALQKRRYIERDEPRKRYRGRN